MVQWTRDETGSFHSYLSSGCRICRTGASLVLFVTGLCERSCFYCPLSAERKGHDIVVANEKVVNDDEDVIKEGVAIDALGTGITGGEPLSKLDRTVHYIELLKKEFGDGHHIHLYTGTLAQNSTLETLHKAGLDEIRFHPPSNDAKDLYRALKFASDLGMEAGVEIPALSLVPRVLEAVRKADAFLNLNELEYSETNQEQLKIRGFVSRDDSCGVLGSEELAYSLMDGDIKLHYCSSVFKDAVQLRERLKRRARRVARQFDMATPDGTLMYGVIEDGNIKAAIRLLDEMDVPKRSYEICEDHVEIDGWILEELLDDLRSLGCSMAMVERYPLDDGMVVERIPL